MEYRNVKTGVVIQTACEVHGEFWEPVTPLAKKTPEPKPAAAKKKTTKKTTAKSGKKPAAKDPAKEG